MLNFLVSVRSAENIPVRSPENIQSYINKSSKVAILTIMIMLDSA